MNNFRSLLAVLARGALLALAAFLGLGYAVAADTDIATAPLFTSSNNQVKPNIMFILDDSGSMAWDYLPDVANFSTTKYGKLSSQCNGVAYNPSIVYTPPTNANGSTQTNASLSVITDISNPTTQTSSQRNISTTVAMPTTMTGTRSFIVLKASNDLTTTSYQIEETVTVFQNSDNSRFFTGEVLSWTRNSTSWGTLVVDISTGFMEGTGSFTSPRIGKGQPSTPKYYRYTGSQRQLGYTYTSSGVITSTTFYQECNSVVGSNPGAGVFTQVNVTLASAEAQNYSNWATYYNTRMKLMKAGVSKAFSSIDSRYRVGYTTINERTAVSGDNFLDIADFDTTHKANFYTKMFAAGTGGSTPLRGALSKAGQYFAKKARDQSVDPIQYSCQRNFAILSTDGYWNTGSEENSTAPLYGPYKLDNATAVGQQDGAGTARPMLDGATLLKTTTESWTRTAVTTTTAVTPQTVVVTTTSGTTTFTPVTRQTRSTFTLLPRTNVDDSDVNRPPNNCAPNCWVVVESDNHNLQTGDSIIMEGGTGTSAPSYRGTFTIERVNSNEFRYLLAARPTNDKGGTFNWRISGTPAGCSAGQARMARSANETREVGNTTVLTVTSGTSTQQTRTLVTTRTDITPWTDVSVESDGVVTSDPPAAAGSTSTSTTTSTVITAGTVTATGPTTATSTSATTTTYVPAPSTLFDIGSCTSTTPATTTTSAVSATPASNTLTGPTPGGSTTNGSTVTTVLSAITETAKVVTVNETTSGGVSNTLADVAMYYYNTDLRTTALANCTGALGTDICNNNVPGNTASAQRSFGDAAAWQHMTTFTLGLGVGGLLTFDPNYLTQTSGDFIDILNRTKNWPAAGSTKGPENTDDLWHTAVNGRGQYFSAGDPNSLATALTGALDSIKAVTGAAAAASTSSLQPVEGDNDVFVAQFTSVKWIGDVLSYRIDPDNGTISTSAAWSAKTQLDAKDYTTRTILYPRSGALHTFTYANLTAHGLNGHFDNFCTKPGIATANPFQCASLGSTVAANLGSNLVDYLRGNQATHTGYYRTRDARLGDIISASPLFIGKPAFKYTENDYQDFVSDNASRTAIVLSAANDGMVHAFARTTGEELWAFMPSFVLPNIYKLADTKYTDNHIYFVDGSPQMGDVYVPSGAKQGWRTIVVGGLNAGGKGYYALDVTDPAAPEFLWEFTHANLGLTFGNPIITKRADGTWVVAFTSGYNNNTGTGDGNGHLFVLNAYTGALITSIPTKLPDNTDAGDTTNPSGLGRLNAWVDTVENNTAKRFYAGDLKGNLWRFDLDNLVEPNGKALQLAKLTSPDGTAQSITTRPALAEVSYNGASYPAVFVATGRYLGTTDAGTTGVQSVYGIKDPLSTDPLAADGWGTARTSNLFVTQTLSITTLANGTKARTLDSEPVNWATKAGWRMDLPGTGERVTVNPQLTVNNLTIGSIMPSDSVCTVGGESFVYDVDITSVGSDSAVVGTYVGNVLIQGLTVVQLADGTNVTIITRSDATLSTRNKDPSISPANLRRSSWRELVD